ncbi:MAG: alpha/beta hydrolase [Acidimicrobiales bacterium]
MTIYPPSVTGLAPAERARLDGEARQLAEMAALMSAVVPDLATLDGLAVARAGQEGMAGPAAENVELIEIAGPTGPLVARVIRPDRIEGVCLDVHGGGWCLGSARQQDPFLVALGTRLGVATVSVDYRLAPEHPFPAGVDDVEAAVRGFLDFAPSHFGTDRLVVQGASAGAHLLTLALLRIRDSDGAEALQPIRGAHLLFGGYDLSATPSAANALGAPIIPTRTIDAFVDHFVPGRDVRARRQPDCSPLYADLRDLPPARFTVGGDDPLLDDSLFMAGRWEAAGNHAELGVYPASIHGFIAFPLGYGPLAAADSADFLGRALDRHLPRHT